jgi:prefoldin beta subunit
MSSADKTGQLSRLQEQLKIIVAERQRLELEIKETERVKSEVQNLPQETELYKSTGPVLYKSNVQDILSGLDKYKTDLSERLALYQSQESALKAEVEKLRKSMIITPKFEPEEG